MKLTKLIQEIWQVFFGERRLPWTWIVKNGLRRCGVGWFGAYTYSRFILTRIKRGAAKLEPKEGTVIVACAINEGFAMQLATMLKSLIYTLKSYKKIKVYVFHKKIKEEIKIKVEQSINSKNIDISWNETDEEKIKDLKVDRHISLEAYYRLLCADILPQEVEKIIYLDSDLIFIEDIGKLWDIDIGDAFLLAVPEMQKKYHTAMSSSSSLFNFYKELGISPYSKVFNSGVLVINLKKWRKFSIGDSIIEFIRKNRNRIRWWDQDGMNAVLAGKWKELDPRWNVTNHLIERYPFFEDSPFDNKISSKLMKEPYIIHFNTPRKPWHRNYNNPYKNLFFFYSDMTEWRGWRP